MAIFHSYVKLPEGILVDSTTDFLVERTSGATVEAGLGVDLHVNGSCASPHQ